MKRRVDRSKCVCACFVCEQMTSCVFCGCEVGVNGRVCEYDIEGFKPKICIFQTQLKIIR